MGKKSSEALTKEQILSATEDAVRRFGMAKTSITDVAKLLNVSHGTIYRHFKSKKEIFEAATEMWLSEKIMQSLSNVARDSSLRGVAHVKAYVEKLFELKRYYARKDEELFAMYAHVTSERPKLVDESINQIVKQMSKLVEECPVRSTDSEEMARAIFYATDRFHHPALANEWKRETIEQEFESIWHLIERGFLQ